jgi:hypothetical protein
MPGSSCPTTRSLCHARDGFRDLRGKRALWQGFLMLLGYLFTFHLNARGCPYRLGVNHLAWLGVSCMVSLGAGELVGHTAATALKAHSVDLAVPTGAAEVMR